TIREMRKALRERDRELAQLRKQAPQRIADPGPKPTLAGCDFDEDRFDAEYAEWTTRKAEADRAETEAQAAARAEQEAWTHRVEAYKADKLTVRAPDFETAEQEVFDILPDNHKALVMMTGKPAALVYALSQNPAKLADLSKLDPVRAAMMIGKLEDKLTVTKRASPPAPDRPLRGNASLAGGTDKELARLEKEAERTGDRTALIRYRRSLKP
ncbi:MAG: hypothetical protein KGP14_14355, partial [Betaproteobacteria bacterium]|nr:hypothetical protein [Betaproteobacteria bacterium]